MELMFALMRNKFLILYIVVCVRFRYDYARYEDYFEVIYNRLLGKIYWRFTEQILLICELCTDYSLTAEIGRGVVHI